MTQLTTPRQTLAADRDVTGYVPPRPGRSPPRTNDSGPDRHLGSAAPEDEVEQLPFSWDQVEGNGSDALAEFTQRYPT
ncbi:hypothetical protein [Nocardia niigatensis]